MNLSLSTGGRCASDWAICVSEGRPSGAGADGIVFDVRNPLLVPERPSYKNRFAVLNSSNPAGAEAVTVTQRFDIINNRLLTIAGAKKVAVKRMYQPLFRDGLFCSIQGLTTTRRQTQRKPKSSLWPRKSPSSIFSRFNNVSKFLAPDSYNSPVTKLPQQAKVS
ncbi:hypothetical protein BANRA_00001 [Escherichia coli]|nr:hypothetical protein BANRA_00001 [Escherichia coli]